MSKLNEHDMKARILNTLEETRNRRLSILSNIPLLRNIEDVKLRKGFLMVTRMVTRILRYLPIKGFFGTIYGIMGPLIFVLMNKVKHTDSFIKNVIDYLRITTLWGLFPVEILSISDSSIEVKYDCCPLGIKNEKKLCQMYMSMEPKLSEKDSFGTRISVLECIPDGQGRCRILFEKK